MPKREPQVKLLRQHLPQPSEADILHAILDYLALRGITAWRVNSGATKIGDRYIRFGKKGMADILGILKPNGRLLAIEVKRPGGRATPEQLAFLKQVNDAGGLGFVACSVEKVIEGLK